MFGKISNKHPDADYLARIIDACQYWITDEECFGPTSAITGDGAIAAAEKAFSVAVGGGRPALLVPSATYGLRCALKALGVGSGDVCLIPAYDWPASFAAVRSLGATPWLVPVREDTYTIDPDAISPAMLAKAKALIACHIHGTPADIPALRIKIGDTIPIVEDCSQATGSRLFNRFVGTFGDIAVHSFGPNKCLYAGEGGMILTRDWCLYEKILREAGHPIRQCIGGVGDEVDYANLSIRPHPMSAIMLLSELRAFDPVRRSRCFDSIAEELFVRDDVSLIGVDNTRSNASDKVPVLLGGNPADFSREFNIVQSGAFELGKMAKTNRPLYLVSRKTAINNRKIISPGGDHSES